MTYARAAASTSRNEDELALEHKSNNEKFTYFALQAAPNEIKQC
jgi:hypothetical protein